MGRRDRGGDKGGERREPWVGREEEENLRGKMNLGKWQLVRGEVWNEWKSTRLVFHWGTTAADCGTKIWVPRLEAFVYPWVVGRVLASTAGARARETLLLTL